MGKMPDQHQQENEDLRARLQEAEETLEAIRRGAVDAIVVTREEQSQIFTLQGAESTYRIILDRLSEGAATLAADGMIVYCNARFAQILGKSLDQVLGTGIEQYILPADRSVFAAMSRQAARDDSRGEVRFRNCNGTVVPMYLSLAALAGDPMASVCMVATDLTECKRSEEILASEQFIRRLIDNTPMGVAVVGRDLRYILANPAYREIVGDRDAPVPGHTIAEVFPPALARIVEPFVQRVLDSGEPLEVQDYEAPVRGRTWWNVNQIPLRNADGDTEAVLILTQEVTERKLAEQALRRYTQELAESEARYRTMGEAIDYGVWLCGPDGGARYTSQSFLDLLNMTMEEMQQFGWTHRLLPEDVEPMLERWLHCVRTGQDWDGEHRIIDRHGQIHYVLTRGKPIRDDKGNITCWAGVNLDISARKRTEQQLKELAETLERRVVERTAVAERRTAQLRLLAAELTQAEQRERQRLALVLHDHLQQILVGMKFSISMLRSHVPAGDGSQILLQLDDLVSQSIDTSRSLTIELCPPILTKGTMSEVLHWLAGWFASKHGLRVEVVTDEQVHPPAEQVRVLLFQATRELLFNIVKHAGVDRAGVEMTRLEGGRVCVTVTDAGIGFDPARVKPGGDGSGGFGLFSLRERMEMIGGQLQLDSAPGKGTRTTLIAPMQMAGAVSKGADMPAGEVLPIAAMTRPPAEPAEHDRQTIRVLLADDHQVMRDGLARLLQTQPDIKVIGLAADGFQAADMALRLRPDIVIMDVNMPHLDGVEATRRIRCQLPATQIVGLSMFAETNVQDAMLDAGAAAYLAKTSPPEALLAAIRKLVGDVPVRPE